MSQVAFIGDSDADMQTAVRCRYDSGRSQLGL